MMIDIKAIGGYFEINDDGNIKNSCDKNNIPSLWVRPVDELVTFYRTHHKDILTSVYIRGSVPRGTMVDSVSDIDSFCLTQTDKYEENTKSIEEFQSDLVRKYSFVNGVEINSYSIENAHQMKALRFFLKTQSLCIFGEDVSTEIEPMSISTAPMSTCLHIAKINADFLVESNASDSIEDAMDLCSWIFKMALRAAFEIVMLREKKYTRDIYFCWKSYSNHYPEHTDLLELALRKAVNPISDIREIRSLWQNIYSILNEHMRKKEHLIGVI